MVWFVSLAFGSEPLPATGADVGQVYEAFLSPHQEPGEEADTPKGVPAKFRSTGTSLTRDERAAAGHRGHGVVSFTRDLSSATVDVTIEGIDPSTVNMFHIHCGKPGILGPILVDLSRVTNLQEDLKDGRMTVTIRNEDIVATAAHEHGDVVAAFTNGCVLPSPSLSGLAPTKVATVAGMAWLAEQGELYFNLHTRPQTYFGDIRGQILEP